MATKSTYSSKGPFHGKRALSDVLFDQVLPKGNSNVFQDSTTPLDSKPKKCQTRKKKKETNQESEETMFQIDDVPKPKKSRKVQLLTLPSIKKTQTRNRKHKESAKNAIKEKDSLIPSPESLESSLTLNVEPCNSVKQKTQSSLGFKHCNKEENSHGAKPSKKDKRGYNLRRWDGKRTNTNLMKGRADEMSLVEKNLELDSSDLSSIETPRDESIIPLSFLRKYSPVLLPLTQSYAADDLFMDEENDKMTWVSISSGPKDSQSAPGSSQYTFVSTYTYGSSTATSGAKVNGQSPTIFLHKPQSHLNSSLQKGKRNIKDMEFPEFISPIASKKVKYLANKKTVPKTSIPNENANGKKPRKCSTLLLESSSCQVPHDSPGLTAISSGADEPTEQRNRKTIKSSTPKVTENQQQHKMKASTLKDQSVSLPVTEEQQKHNKMKASTPKDQAVSVSMDLSPVPPASWDEDELPLKESREINTSEIIVPSLMEITDLPRKEGSAREEKNDPQVLKAKITTCFNQTQKSQRLSLRSENGREPGRNGQRDTNEQEENISLHRVQDSHSSRNKQESLLCSKEKVEVIDLVNSKSGSCHEKGWKQRANTSNWSLNNNKQRNSTFPKFRVSKSMSQLKQNCSKTKESTHPTVRETRQSVAPTTKSSQGKAKVVGMPRSRALSENHSSTSFQEFIQDQEMVTAEGHEPEKEHNEDLANLQSENKKTSSNGKNRWRVTELLGKQQTEAETNKTKGTDQVPHSGNLHLRECFVNRLIRQHRLNRLQTIHK